MPTLSARSMKHGMGQLSGRTFLRREREREGSDGKEG